MSDFPEIIKDPAKRQEFVLIFDVTKGNPNGDPDAANAPRVDPETGHGLVSDVALKRKVRDYLALTRNLPIFISSDMALNDKKKEAEKQLEPPLTPKERESKRPNSRLGGKLCEIYYDIRMFGAVLSTGEERDRLNAGQVRGPVQLTFANSIDRITPLHQTITRQARTTDKRMESGDTEIGEKWLIPYALYRTHGYINPFFAEKTGVATDDLEAFWEALINLFEFDRSAGRGEMVVRGLYVFTHENKLGNAPAHKLFELITIPPAAEGSVPRQFSDYEIRLDRDGVPAGVTFTPLIG